MNSGWVKSYRKIKDSDIMKDPLALQMFIWLLHSVDRTTGKYTTGRYMLAEALSMKPPTVQKVLLRLSKKYKIVSLRSINKYTEISLINWAKYQGGEDEVSQESINKVSTKYQQSITIQEEENIRSKEYIRESTSINYLSNIPKDHVSEFSKVFQCSESQVVSKGDDLLNYCKAKGKKYSDYKALLRNALKKDYGVRKVVTATVPELPEYTEAQRFANIERFRNMRKQVFKN